MRTPIKSDGTQDLTPAKLWEICTSMSPVEMFLVFGDGKKKQFIRSKTYLTEVRFRPFLDQRPLSLEMTADFAFTGPVTTQKLKASKKNSKAKSKP